VSGHSLTHSAAYKHKYTHIYIYIYTYSFKDEGRAASARRCSVTNLKRLPLLLDAKNKARNENVAKVKELLVHTLGNLFKTSIFLVFAAVAYI